MNFEIIQAVLPWLAVLACPLLMLFCMRGMFGRKCDKHEQGDAENPSAGSHFRGNPDAEIRALKARLAKLEAERPRAGL